MSTTVVFKYKIGEKVTSIYGDEGYIDVLAVDINNKIMYLVKSGLTDSGWLYEHQIADKKIDEKIGYSDNVTLRKP
jgi:hypothetical protein